MSDPLTLRTIVASPLVRAAVVGLAATEALDLLSIVIYEKESPFLRFRENRTRHFEHAYERAVDNFAHQLGRSLTRREMQTWGWRFHKAFSMTGGLAYTLLRKRYPRIGVGGGLAFGAAFFFFMDELMMPLLKLTPGPRAFSWKVHARGALAHVAYGVAAEMAWRGLAKLTGASPRALPAAAAA
jgi:hypothetical protein